MSPDAPAGHFEALLTALRASQRRLSDAVQPLSADQLKADSYDDEWSLAQVLSHIGSGSEVFTLIFDAGSEGRAAPEVNEIAPIWERWNSLGPEDQASQAIVAGETFLNRISATSEEERASWQLNFFGADHDLTDLVTMRLSEHAVHTWDVVVALDPTAQVAADAIALLGGLLDGVIGRFGKSDSPIRIAVQTTDPAGSYVLAVGPDGGSLTPADTLDADVDGTLSLPTEALLRLAYGRLDPDHAAGVRAEGFDLDALRRAFPGF